MITVDTLNLLNFNPARCWPSQPIIAMQPTTHAGSHAHASHHEEPGFWQKYIFSTDHKVIGIQYGVTALMFLFFGFCLMMMMRWQSAYPGHADSRCRQVALQNARRGHGRQRRQWNVGVMMPDLYNSFGAMHGTIMVFLGIVPLAFGAFGNFVVPLQIGAPDMTFPRVNMASYHVFFWAAWSCWPAFSFPAARPNPAGPPTRRWPPPLAHPNGQAFWLVGMVCLITPRCWARSISSPPSFNCARRA